MAMDSSNVNDAYEILFQSIRQQSFISLEKDVIDGLYNKILLAVDKFHQSLTSLNMLSQINFSENIEANNTSEFISKFKESLNLNCYVFDANFMLGNSGALKYGEVIWKMKKNPMFLAYSLSSAEQLDISDEDIKKCIRIIIELLYCRGILPCNEMIFLNFLLYYWKLLIHNLHDAENLLDKETFLFSLRMFLFTYRPFKLFLINVLRDPILSVLELQCPLRSNSASILRDMSSEEREVYFGHKDNKDTACDQFIAESRSRYFHCVDKFLSALQSNIRYMPAQMIWLLSSLCQLMRQFFNLKCTDVQHICFKIILHEFVLPAVRAPDKWGIITDFPLNRRAKTNLEAVAKGLSSYTKADDHCVSEAWSSCDVDSQLTNGSPWLDLNFILQSDATIFEMFVTVNQSNRYDVTSLFISKGDLEFFINIFMQLMRVGSFCTEQVQMMDVDAPDIIKLLRNLPQPNRSSLTPFSRLNDRSAKMVFSAFDNTLTQESKSSSGSSTDGYSYQRSSSSLNEQVLDSSCTLVSIVYPSVSFECPGKMKEDQVNNVCFNSKPSFKDQINEMENKKDFGGEHLTQLEVSSVTSEKSMKKLRFETVDNVDVISEAASTSIGSVDFDADTFSDIHTGRSDGRSTPRSMATSDDGLDSYIPTRHPPNVPPPDNINDKFGKFEIEKRRHHKEQPSDFISDTWSVDVMASDQSEPPPETNEVERLSEIMEDCELGTRGARVLDETASETWSVDVAASEAEIQEDRLVDLDDHYQSNIGDEDEEREGAPIYVIDSQEDVTQSTSKSDVISQEVSHDILLSAQSSQESSSDEQTQAVDHVVTGPENVDVSSDSFPQGARPKTYRVNIKSPAVDCPKVKKSRYSSFESQSPDSHFGIPGGGYTGFEERSPTLTITNELSSLSLPDSKDSRIDKEDDSTLLSTSRIRRRSLQTKKQPLIQQAVENSNICRKPFSPQRQNSGQFRRRVASNGDITDSRPTYTEISTHQISISVVKDKLKSLFLHFSNDSFSMLPKRPHLSLKETLLTFLYQLQSNAIHLRLFGATAQLSELISIIEKMKESNIHQLVRDLKDDNNQRSHYITYLVRSRQDLQDILASFNDNIKSMNAENENLREQLVHYCCLSFLKLSEKFQQFVDSFHSLTVVDEMSELFDSFIAQWRNTLMTELRPINDESIDDNLMHMVEKALSRIVMDQVYHHAFHPNGSMNVLRDEMLSENIHRLRQSGQSENCLLQISKNRNKASLKVYICSYPWTAAQTFLHQLAMHRLPQDKAVCIRRACQSIMQLLSSCSRAAIPSADELFPVLVYIVIKANPPCILSTVDFINNFCERHLSGEDSYTWITFKTAIEQIKQMASE